MDIQQLLSAAKKIRDRVKAENEHFAGAKAEVCEFLRLYAGPKTSFYEMAKQAQGRSVKQHLLSTMESFISFVEAGLHAEISPSRKAQLEVVSDLLNQANDLIESNKVHPAAPAVLIGATLEEFLRNWVEAEGLDMGAKKPNLDSYTKALREAELIVKQDVKDITAWTGIRNHAAHGEWEEVGDRNRIRNMLEGVNLFLRKYTE
jgi:hypothetical protein